MLVTLQAHSPQPHPNLTPAPNTSGPNDIPVRSCFPDSFITTSDNSSPVPPPVWQNLVADNNDHVQANDPVLSKSMVVDYQNLSPIDSLEDLTKNKHQLNMTDVPNAILQMAYNKIYVPLSMLTTSALSKIHNNDNLKYRKIPFSNGIGKQSLNKSSFPAEDMLTETMFFQSY